MAALRQPERVAHDRQRAARGMDQGLSTLPRRARRPAAALNHARVAEDSSSRRLVTCFTIPRRPDLLAQLGLAGRCNMLDRRLIVAGLGTAGIATFISNKLWAASIKPDESSALLVIDVQNCFLPGGSLAVKDGEQVVPVINRIAKGFANVVMTQDWHTAGHISFASTHSGKKPFETVDLAYGKQVLWPDHCVQGTEGAAISMELSIPQTGLIIRKGFHRDVDSYSAFTEADGQTT